MNLTDGEWHRLHPATPLLRGGIFFIAIAGFTISNLRERLLEFFFHVPGVDDDPIDEIYTRGMVGWVLLAVLGVLLVIIALFYVSWRMHTFRVTSDVVEVRSGVLLRTNRRARLDRIQGVSINRPLLARLFGAAKLDVTVAGNDGNVQLAYLASSATDELRREILRLASTRSAPPAPVVPADPAAAAAGADAVVGPGAGLPADAPRDAVPGLVGRRVSEFLAPELDPDAAPPESIVRIPPLRLVLSVLLSGYTLGMVVVAVAVIVGLANGAYWPLFIVIPLVIGSISYHVNHITRMLRYSIAGTADGVRVGYGLLATNNETLPPGRIHAIGVTQPLFWRPLGWWHIQVNTAGRAQRDSQNRQQTTVLPVGTADDVPRVLALMLPAFTATDLDGVIRAGMNARDGAGGFSRAPRRAAWVQPFSWRRIGYRIVDGVVLVRRGVFARRLVIVPLARLQSVAIHQGPVDRALGLASVTLQTVAGPVTTELDAADTGTALAMFGAIGADAVAYAARDTGAHWRSA